MDAFHWIVLAGAAIYLLGSRLGDYAAMCGPRNEPPESVKLPESTVPSRAKVEMPQRVAAPCLRCMRGEVIEERLARDDPGQIWDVVVVRYPAGAAEALRAQHVGRRIHEMMAGISGSTA